MQKYIITPQMQSLAASQGWDCISYVGELDGSPIFQFGFKNTPKGAKLGYPPMYAQQSDGSLEELSLTDIRRMLKQPLCRQGGELLEY